MTHVTRQAGASSAAADPGDALRRAGLLTSTFAGHDGRSHRRPAGVICFAAVDDDGHAISFQVLRRGTTVRSSDGIDVGTVRRAQETGREHIFDGIVIDTKGGRRFVDAPEVARIHERAVVLTITAADVAALPEPTSRMAARMSQATSVRRAKRLGFSLRERWERR